MRKTSIIIVATLWVISWAAGALTGYFTPVSPTGLPYTIIVNEVKIDGRELPAGSEVAVFDDSLCVGVAVSQGGTFSLTAWQRSVSPYLPGFQPGDSMTFKVYTQLYNQNWEFSAAAVFQVGDGTFGYGQFSVVNLAVTSGLAPQMTVSPQQIDFGQIAAGETAADSILIGNSGNANLMVTGLELPPDISAAPTNFLLPPGAQKTVQISFNPTTAGSYNTKLKISSDDPATPLGEVLLTAFVLPAPGPVFQISTDTLDFGNMVPGKIGSRQLLIGNIGDADLIVSSISRPAGVTLNHNSFTLQPGQTIQLEVSLQLGSPGQFQQNITFLSNAGNQEVVLQAFGYSGYFGEPVETGLPYSVVVSRARVDGHELSLGDEVALFDDTLLVGLGVYRGQMPLTITAWEAAPQQGLPGFRAGDSIRVRLYASTWGIQGELPAKPQWVVGDGTFGFGQYSGMNIDEQSTFQPVAVFDQSPLNFGLVNTGQSRGLLRALKNQGAGILQITGVESSSPAFTVSQYPQQISGGDTADIEITFTPLQPGAFNGSVKIRTNAPQSPELLIPVSGMGIPPSGGNLTVSDTLISFGGTPIQQVSRNSFFIYNYGGEPLTISQISSSAPTVVWAEPGSFTIPPGLNQEVTVNFSPPAKSLHDEELTIQSNGGNQVIRVSGIGTDNHFRPVSPTGKPYPILFTGMQDTVCQLAIGDEIAVFDNGLCVGKAVYTGKDTLEIVAWERDLFYNLAGFTPGDSIEFKVWANYQGSYTEYDIVPSFLVGNETYGDGQFSVVKLEALRPFVSIAGLSGSYTAIEDIIQKIAIKPYLQTRSIFPDSVQFRIVSGHHSLSIEADSLVMNYPNGVLEDSVVLEAYAPYLGVSGRTELSVNITPVNDPPVLAGIPDIAFPEDSSFVLSVAPYLFDIDNSAAELILNANVLSPGDSSVLHIGIDSASKQISFSAAPDSNGTFPVVVSVSDPEGLTDSDTLVVTVQPVNDSPVVLEPVGDFILPEDFTSFIAVDLDTVFFDVDAGDSLNYALFSNNPDISATLQGSRVQLSAAANYFGSALVMVWATDGGGLSVADTFTVTVTPVNDPPQAVADSVTTSEDTPVTIAVLANDSDIENDPLSVASVTQGAHGNVAINPDSTLTYTPDANYNGTDQFSYVVSDGNGGLDTAEVFVTVTAVNDPPVVIHPVGDIVLPEDFTSFIAVDLDTVFFDVDAGDFLNYALLSNNPDISATLQGTRVQLSAAANYFGSALVMVWATDGGGLSVADTFTVTVTPVNDPPQAVADSATTNEDTPVTIAVTANDSDIENDPLAVAAVTQGAHGSVTINPNSTVTYTPDANYHGADQFSYVISDGNGGLDTAEVFVTVTATNDPPVVVHPIADMSVPEDFAAFTSADLDSVFSDIDGDSLVYGAVSLGGNVIVQLNGSLVLLGSTPNYFGPETIVVNADDQVNRVVVSDTFIVTVTPVNDPPLAVSDSVTTTEDTPVTIAVLANDSDIENDPLSVAAVTPGAHGSVVINPDSTVTYTPDANYNGADQFIYVVSDGNGGLDTADVFVTILEENDPPQLSALPPVQKMEDELLLWPLVSWYPFVSDPDDPDSSLSWSFEQEDLVSLQQTGDTVRFQPVQNAFGMDSILVIVTDSQLSDSTTLLLEVLPVNDPPEITFTDSLFCNEDDSLSLWLDTCVVDVDDPLNALSWQVQILGAAQNPADSITVHYDPQTHIVTFIPDSNYTAANVPVELVVSDTSGAADITVLPLTVVGVNDPPQFIGPLPQIVFAEDDSLIYPISNWFPFVYDPDDSVGALSYLLMPGATVQIQPGNASYFLSAPENWFGSDTLMLHISDGEYIDSAKIDVLVTPVNDPPVISDSLPDYFEFVNGDSVLLNLWEYVYDPETPDSLLSFSTGSDTSGLVIQYQSTTGWLKLQAAQHFAGGGKVFITVSDDSGAVASDTIAVMVNPNALDEWRFQIPKQFVLYQNYPNPFNPVTTIRFGVPKAGEVKIEVYNILGQKVAELLNRRMEPGYHEVRFNGAQLGSGIYIYRMQAENFQAIKKLLLVK